MKRTWITIAAALTVFSASFTTAQTITMASAPSITTIVARQVARLTALLDLTTAEQTEATTFFTKEQTALATIQTTIETAQTALQTAIEANSASGIATAAGQIGAATTQQFAAEATADAAFYAILTTAQQTKYKQVLLGGLLDVPAPDGGHGGHGGPH
jgi:hypothetical protein